MANNGTLDLDKEDEGVLVDPIAIFKVSGNNAAATRSYDSSTGSDGCLAWFEILALLALSVTLRRKH